VADDGESLAGLDAEGDIAENPVLFARIRDGAVTEPNIAKFDFAARMFERIASGGAETVAGSSSSLKIRSEAAWRIAGC